MALTHIHPAGSTSKAASTCRHSGSRLESPPGGATGVARPSHGAMLRPFNLLRVSCWELMRQLLAWPALLPQMPLPLHVVDCAQLQRAVLLLPAVELQSPGTHASIQSINATILASAAAARALDQPSLARMAAGAAVRALASPSASPGKGPQPCRREFCAIRLC
jgi:hypothetical protein